MNLGSVWGSLLRLLRSPVLMPVVALPLAGAVITYFATNHPPDDVNLSTEHISGIEVSEGASATITAVADHVRFAGATGRLEVVVPLAASSCLKLPGSVNPACSGDILTVTPPFSADAVNAQEFVMVPEPADQARLDLQPAANGGGVAVAVTGGTMTRLCVRQKPGASGLTLHMGSGVTTFPALTAQLPDCTGVVVRVESADPQGSSAFAFLGMKSARVELTGKHMTLKADSLTVTQHSTAKSATFNRQVDVYSDKPFTIAAVWAAPSFAADAGVRAHATSVQEANAEWLDNGLIRNPWTSLIDSGATALVALLFALAVIYVARKAGPQQPVQPPKAAP